MPAEKKNLSPAAPWLSIVGIGEDGLEGLSAEAKRHVAQAEFVFGGSRHLALAKPIITGEARPWPSPFDPEMRAVTVLAGHRVCVLASGDPFCHGVGTTIARHVDRAEFQSFPVPSAFALAANRLGWALPEVETISLHGKPIDLIRPLLHPGVRILALTSDSDGPSQVARLLAETGFGQSRLMILEAIGGPQERVSATVAASFDVTNINCLNVLAIEIQASPEARILPLAPGIADDLFEHDGQITKREVRTLTLSALAPLRGELLWDIGAGSGSIAIEWMLRHPSMRAIAVEMSPERADRIARNAASCGVPSLAVIRGQAPHALAGLPAPDAIFVGGGGSEPGVIKRAMDALRPDGRLVANAVTLEMEAVLLSLHARLGGNLIRIALSRAAPVGAMQGWRPAMPVTQWTWVKP